MYVLAIVRYRRTIDEAGDFRDAHRDYLLSLKRRGVLLASGPFDPHVGGAFLLRVQDGDSREMLDGIRDEDPFTKQRLAQYEFLVWDVKTGKDDLDRIR